MKTLAILFTLFYFLNAIAAAPYGFKGQNQSTTLYSNVLQAPNNLVTNLGGINGLMETGNNNILSNPSFEHLTFDSSWTNAGIALPSVETTNVIHGKKAVRIDASAETVIFRQDSSLYAAQFADGVQGLVSVRIKSDVALKVCSRQAGTTSTSNCVDVVANNKWGLYKVPMILGATSNGINIASTGLVSGTIYIDDAFVGAASLTQNMNACDDVSCETEFSARVSSLGVASAENKDFISSCSRSTTGTYSCLFNSGVFSLSPNCSVTPITSAFNTISRDVIATSSGIDYKVVNVGSTPALNDQEVTIICQKQGADFTAAKQLSNGNTYSSTNADTDWASCGHTTSSFTGFGTVSAIETQCKRQGGDLLMKGKFAYNSGTATETRLSLPLWNGSQLNSVGSSSIPSLQMTGDAASTGFASNYFRMASLIEPSVSYMTFGVQQTTSSVLTKAQGSLFAGAGSVSFNARIPIEGWQQSNIIIGQFNGLESCNNTLECTDTFSAKVSAAGVVSGENVDWINGSCSVATGTFTCNFNSSIFTVAPNCVASPNNTPGVAASGISVIGQTSSAVTVYTYDNVQAARPFSLVCQKQGVDYIGKTAKAVASDQNVRTPGVTNAVLMSAKVDGSAVVTNQKGNFISSCTGTTTRTCTFSTSFLSEPNCLVNCNLNAAGCISARITTQSSSSVSFETYSTSAVTANPVILSCHGERQ
jgi:hypothetical protein